MCVNYIIDCVRVCREKFSFNFLVPLITYIGCVYHVYEMTIVYLAYSTITLATTEIPNEVTFPAYTFSVPYTFDFTRENIKAAGLQHHFDNLEFEELYRTRSIQ